jgi:DeoR family fructose operon transcriptional repressor
MKSDRSTLIRDHLFAHGPATVDDLSLATGASPATIRRDLTALESQGLIQRDHGSARLAEGTGREIAFATRARANLTAKRAIAEAAFPHLSPGQTVFLDAGTTTHQLARRIRLQPMPLTIATNCIPIAEELSNLPAVTVLLIGGRYRPENASLVGLLAERALSDLWFDTLFMGAGCVAPDLNLYSVDPDEARANALMLTRTSRSFILADSSKFGRALPWRVAPLTPETHLITDTLPQDWRDRLAAIPFTEGTLP